MTGAPVEISELCFEYPDGTAALSGVSFSAQSGESVALVGANGAGKSTLLMQLNGCLRAKQGAVSIDGVELRDDSLAEIRRLTGTVFHDPDDQLLMPTVLADVSFGLRAHGIDSGEAERRSLAVLESMQALYLKDRPPHRLSSGEKRLVCLAGVLILEPSVLLMDEPTSGLDPRGRRELIARLQGLPQTRIIATHDLEFVVQVCSRVVVLSRGAIVADGIPSEVLGDEALMLAHGLETPHILQHGHPHNKVPA